MKLSVLFFAAIVKLLYTRWVYDSAILLALGDKNQIVANWLQISSYALELSPVAIVSQYEHIISMR